MKITLYYSTKITLCVHAFDTIATIDLGCKSLADTLEYVDCIFNDVTMFRGACVACVHIIDSNTGELIAECEPDQPIEVNPDWDFNEDEGFNPYEGCYDYDC